MSDINNSSFRIYSAVAAACNYSIGDKNKNGNVYCETRWNPTADDLMVDDWEVQVKESWTIRESYIIQKKPRR